MPLAHVNMCIRSEPYMRLQHLRFDVVVDILCCNIFRVVLVLHDDICITNLNKHDPDGASDIYMTSAIDCINDLPGSQWLGHDRTNQNEGHA